MKRLVTTVLLLAGFVWIAGAQSTNELRDKARAYTREGDYNNAIVVLSRALQSDRDNIEIQKDLAFTYYLKKDYVRAIEAAKPIVERPDADVQSFQILGLVYKALEEKKELGKMYKTALKKFPKSGPLYNEYGELQWDNKEYKEAIKTWEKGIENDPGSAGNYYNAAKYYYFSSDKVWGLLYGEMFINIESYTARTEEIKKILFEGYKKLFSNNDIRKNQDMKNDFVRYYLELMDKNGVSVATGITPESLTTLRARFTLDWFQRYAGKYPFRLFDHYDQLMKLGLFDAYNQWVFQSASNPEAYKKWTEVHADAQKEFIRLQQNRLFKVPALQYYQTRPR
jgi:tetratricopeptide (TPR) repeat protein